MSEFENDTFEHIQTGTFGTCSDKKNMFTSKDPEFIENLNPEQQDLIIKYMRNKIQELERLVYKCMKTYKISETQIRAMTKKVYSEQNTPDKTCKSEAPYSINLSFLSKEPLSNDKF